MAERQCIHGIVESVECLECDAMDHNMTDPLHARIAELEASLKQAEADRDALRAALQRLVGDHGANDCDETCPEDCAWAAARAALKEGE